MDLGRYSSDGLGSQNSDILNSDRYIERHASQRSYNGNGDINTLQDPDAMELYSRIRTQESEIRSLREQVAAACLKEVKLLTEKYALEKKIADLRLAIDEKQNEATTYALNELARRKGDLEQNLKLANELKVTEDDRYLFMSSMLGLLAQFDFWPPLLNASVVSSYVKRLHDHLQWKISNTNDKIREVATPVEDYTQNHTQVRDSYISGRLTNQVPQRAMDGVAHHDLLKDGLNADIANTSVKHLVYSQHSDANRTIFDGEMQQSHNEDSVREFKFTVNGPTNEPRVRDSYSGASDILDDNASSGASQGPGIEGFQIIGEATPGNQLLGCGYPVCGTSLCMFQWVRHFRDGRPQYIEGATNPEYVVTADDVDKLIAVECIPMDKHGRQGEIVRHFANDRRKIKCDPDMQLEIDSYISRGATFKVHLLVESSDNWEPATLTVRHWSYEIKLTSSGEPTVTEKFFKEFSIKVPCGPSTQFVLTTSDGLSSIINTSNVRMRDAVVVTMRMFQSKALDEKLKGKA